MERPVRVPSCDLLCDSSGDCVGIVTGGTEVGRASLRNDSVDTETEARGKPVDEKANQVLIGVVG